MYFLAQHGFPEKKNKKKSFSSVEKFLLPKQGEKAQAVGVSLMLPPCYPPLLCFGLQSGQSDPKDHFYAEGKAVALSPEL